MSRAKNTHIFQVQLLCRLLYRIPMLGLFFCYYHIGFIKISFFPTLHVVDATNTDKYEREEAYTTDGNSWQAQRHPYWLQWKSRCGFRLINWFNWVIMSTIQSKIERFAESFCCRVKQYLNTSLQLILWYILRDGVRFEIYLKPCRWFSIYEPSAMPIRLRR